MKTILGTGQLGLVLMQQLVERNPNEDILLVNRSGKLSIPIPSNVQLLSADVTSSQDMEQIAKRSDILFNCTDVPYHQWAQFYPATAHALAHALRNTEAQLVFADNMYSYGNVAGIEMHENLPHAATTKKGIIRAGVIHTLLYSKEAFNKRVAFVKASDFIGPGIHKGLLGTSFLDQVYKGKTVRLFGNLSLPHSFTFIHDMANAMIQVGTATDAFEQIWHVPNAPALSVDKWVHLFEVITSKRIKKSVTPAWLIRIAGLFNSLIQEFYEMAYQFNHSYLVNHDKYVKRFGNQYTYPSEIVKQTVEWYLSSQKK